MMTRSKRKRIALTTEISSGEMDGCQREVVANNKVLVRVEIEALGEHTHGDDGDFFDAEREGTGATLGHEQADAFDPLEEDGIDIHFLEMAFPSERKAREGQEDVVPAVGLAALGDDGGREGTLQQAIFPKEHGREIEDKSAVEGHRLDFQAQGDMRRKIQIAAIGRVKVGRRDRAHPGPQHLLGGLFFGQFDD
jgi:hypothetical protein